MIKYTLQVRTLDGSDGWRQLGRRERSVITAISRGFRYLGANPTHAFQVLDEYGGDIFAVNGGRCAARAPDTPFFPGRSFRCSSLIPPARARLRARALPSESCSLESSE